MEFRGTTICAVKRGDVTAVAGDGQVTMGESVIMKGNAVKVKRIYNGKVVIGFAGSVSDAFALSEKFEEMLQKYSGNLMRSAVELAELWRSDKMYRKLEALLIVADHLARVVHVSHETIGMLVNFFYRTDTLFPLKSPHDIVFPIFNFDGELHVL